MAAGAFVVAVPRAVHQIPGQPAISRRSGHDHQAHGALPDHDPDLAAGRDRRGATAQAAERALVGHDGDAGRRLRLPARRRRCGRTAAADQRGAEDVPGGHAVPLPRGLDRHAARDLDDDRPRVRRDRRSASWPARRSCRAGRRTHQCPQSTDGGKRDGRTARRQRHRQPHGASTPEERRPLPRRARPAARGGWPARARAHARAVACRRVSSRRSARPRGSAAASSSSPRARTCRFAG